MTNCKEWTELGDVRKTSVSRVLLLNQLLVIVIALWIILTRQPSPALNMNFNREFQYSKEEGVSEVNIHEKEALSCYLF